MLQHPNLFLVKSDLPTFKYAFKWVEQKCDIDKLKDEMITSWSVQIDCGAVVLLWKATKKHGKVMAHSRLPFVIEKRDSLISIYQIEGVIPYLLDLKLLSESYDFIGDLTNEQKRERHLKQMREWYRNNKEQARKAQKANYERRKISSKWRM